MASKLQTDLASVDFQRVIITQFGAALTMENPDDANCLKGLAQQLKTLGVMGAYHWHGWHNGDSYDFWDAKNQEGASLVRKVWDSCSPSTRMPWPQTPQTAICIFRHAEMTRLVALNDDNFATLGDPWRFEQILCHGSTVAMESLVPIQCWRSGEAALYCHEGWEGDDDSADGSFEKVAFHAFPPDCELPGVVKVYEFRKGALRYYAHQACAGFANIVQMADGEQALLPLAPGKHKRMNLNALAIVINLLLPWCFFCFICYALSFTWHYQAPVFAWSSVLLGLGIAASSGKLAFRSDESDPKWYTFFTFAMLAAVLLAVACGEWNYRTYNEAVYDLENMNAYPNVNPAALKGQQLMDAGRLYFVEGSALDLKKAMSFKNDDTYCVAPIVVGKDQMPSYDYWAVGMNCCPGQSPDFRCGEYNNAHARAGLRLMSDDQRPFYRLAVQQAEAAYNLRSEHPMFFHWVQDPVAMANERLAAGTRFVLKSITCFFVFNFFCLSCAIIVFSKFSGH